MRPKIVTQTGVGSSAPVVVDYSDSNFQVGFAVDATGTVNFTVEYTCDPIMDPAFTAAGYTALWLPHDTVAAKTADIYGAFKDPVYAIRVTVNSGTGSARMTVLQTNRA